MKIAIVGGGISGLTAAWRLVRAGYSPVLFEKTDRLGGVIGTETTPFLCEKGPRTFRVSRSPQFLALIREAGLEGEIIPSQPAARFLWHRGALRSPLRLLLPHLGRLLCEPFIAKGTGEETIGAFAARRFGAKLAHLLFDPLTLGIYGGDMGVLSMQTCFPTLVEWEQTHGSVLKGFWRAPKSKPGLFTLRRGLQSLIDALQIPLDVRFRTEITQLSFDGKWHIGADAFDHLFCALPGDVAAQLLPLPPLFSTPLLIANIGYHSQPFDRRGYGYLIPSSEGETLLGMIWDSAVFPTQAPGVRLTALLRPCADPAAAVCEALSRHLKLPVPDHLSLWPASLPQFRLGHSIPQFQKLSLLGNYIDGVSVEHCVARANRLVQEIIAN